MKSYFASEIIPNRARTLRAFILSMCGWLDGCLEDLVLDLCWQNVSLSWRGQNRRSDILLEV